MMVQGDPRGAHSRPNVFWVLPHTPESEHGEQRFNRDA